MLDNQLIQLILTTLNSQLAAVGIPGIPVVQAYQPTQQGVETQTAAYLFKLGDVRVGFPQEKNVWNTGTMEEDTSMVQTYQTSFQISALSTQDPNNPNQKTASDILNLISAILQNSQTTQAFSAVGVGILKVKDVRNPYFTDDRGRHEANPNFDFTLTHTQVISYTSPFTTTVDFNLTPVQ